MPVRSERYKIGMPLSSSLENDLRYIANQDFGLGRKSRPAQFGRNPLDQCTSGPLFVFQLGSVTLSHLRRRHGLNRLQHV